jgi:hypothetical protein
VQQRGTNRCADDELTVPTTISDSAVAMRSQIEINVATSARPNHNAACAQTSVMSSALRYLCDPG